MIEGGVGVSHAAPGVFCLDRRTGLGIRAGMKRLVQLSLRGARANLVPGIALQVVAALVLATYFWVPPASGVFVAIGDLKERYGLLFAALSTGVFGGVIPFLYLYFSGKIVSGHMGKIGLFYLLFWIWKGIEVDLLYQAQAIMFGDTADFATVAKKVAFDQFVYCPLISAPVMAVLYAWKDSLFDLQTFRRKLNKRLFTFEIPGVLVSIWLVWIPGTAFIYSLPLPLQIPLFNLVLCFFVLLVSALSSPDGPPVVETKYEPA